MVVPSSLRPQGADYGGVLVSRGFKQSVQSKIPSSLRPEGADSRSKQARGVPSTSRSLEKHFAALEAESTGYSVAGGVYVKGGVFGREKSFGTAQQAIAYAEARGGLKGTEQFKAASFRLKGREYSYSWNPISKLREAKPTPSMTAVTADTRVDSPTDKIPPKVTKYTAISNEPVPSRESIQRWGGGAWGAWTQTGGEFKTPSGTIYASEGSRFYDKSKNITYFGTREGLAVVKGKVDVLPPKTDARRFDVASTRALYQRQAHEALVSQSRVPYPVVSAETFVVEAPQYVVSSEKGKGAVVTRFETGKGGFSYPLFVPASASYSSALFDVRSVGGYLGKKPPWYEPPKTIYSVEGFSGYTLKTESKEEAEYFAKGVDVRKFQRDQPWIYEFRSKMKDLGLNFTMTGGFQGDVAGKAIFGAGEFFVQGAQDVSLVFGGKEFFKGAQLFFPRKSSDAYTRSVPKMVVWKYYSPLSESEQRTRGKVFRASLDVALANVAYISGYGVRGLGAGAEAAGKGGLLKKALVEQPLKFAAKHPIFTGAALGASSGAVSYAAVTPEYNMDDFLVAVGKGGLIGAGYGYGLSRISGVGARYAAKEDLTSFYTKPKSVSLGKVKATETGKIDFGVKDVKTGELTKLGQAREVVSKSKAEVSGFGWRADVTDDAYTIFARTKGDPTTSFVGVGKGKVAGWVETTRKPIYFEGRVAFGRKGFLVGDKPAYAYTQSWTKVIGSKYQPTFSESALQVTDTGKYARLFSSQTPLKTSVINYRFEGSGFGGEYPNWFYGKQFGSGSIMKLPPQAEAAARGDIRLGGLPPAAQADDFQVTFTGLGKESKGLQRLIDEIYGGARASAGAGGTQQIVKVQSGVAVKTFPVSITAKEAGAAAGRAAYKAVIAETGKYSFYGKATGAPLISESRGRSMPLIRVGESRSREGVKISSGTRPVVKPVEDTRTRSLIETRVTVGSKTSPVSRLEPATRVGTRTRPSTRSFVEPRQAVSTRTALATRVAPATTTTVSVAARTTPVVTPITPPPNIKITTIVPPPEFPLGEGAVKKKRFWRRKRGLLGKKKKKVRELRPWADLLSKTRTEAFTLKPSKSPSARTARKFWRKSGGLFVPTAEMLSGKVKKRRRWI